MPEQNQNKEQLSTENPATQTISTNSTHLNSGIINYIETHDRLFNAISSALIAIFTIILAISTICLWKSTAGLEKFAKQQASDMKESIAAAKDAAKAASDANQLNHDNFLATERHMKESIAAAKDAAKAASDANRLSRDNFLATERPWIKADIGVGGPLLYDINGVNITVRFQLKNVGHSPATHVWINLQALAPALGVGHDFDPRAAQQKIFAETKKRPLYPFGYTIFPGDTITQDITVNIGADELKRITQKANMLFPYIVGTIDYSFVFEDGHHQTGFIIEVRRSDAPRPESTAKNRSPSAIFTDEGNIPAMELRLFRSFLGQEYAD